MAGSMASLDTDISDIWQEQAAGFGPKCSVAAALRALGAEDAAKLRLAFATEGLQHTAISRWLRKHGLLVNDATIARHRRGECRCDA